MNFIKRITLSDFRRFGGKAVFDIPNCPGAMVVVAPNGSGKTSLFEAIEFALAGTVMRVGENFDVLVREGKSQAAVQLDFTNGVAFSSFSLGGHVEHGGDVGEILGFQGEGSISELLRLTHLMDQKEKIWFVSRDSEGGGKQLSQHPAISEGFLAQSAVTATKAALTREVTQAEKEKSEANGVINTWQELKQKRDLLTMRFGTTSSSRSLMDLWNNIQELASRDWAIGSLSNDDTSYESIKISLAAIIARFEVHEQRLNSDRGRLESLFATIEQYDILLNNLHKYQSEKNISVSQREASSERRNEIIKILSAKDLELSKCKSRIEAVTIKLEIKNKLSMSIEQEAIYNNNLRELESAIAKTQNEIVGLKIKQELLSAAVSRWNDITIQEQKLQKQLTDIDTATSDLNRWGDLEKARIDVKHQIEMKNLALASIQNRVEVQKADKTDLEQKLDSINQIMSQLSMASDAIQSSVATIAKTLAPDVEICPVCLHYHGASKLREQMEKALSATNPILGETAKQKNEAEADLAVSIKQLGVVEKEAMDLQLELAQLNHKLDAIMVKILEIQNSSIFIGSVFSDAQGLIDQLRSNSESARFEIDRLKNDLVPECEVNRQYTQAFGEFSEKNQAVIKLQEQEASLRLEVDKIRENISDHKNALGPINEDDFNISQAISGIEAEIARLESDRQAEASALQALSVELTECDALIATSNTYIVNCENDIRSKVEIWRSASLPDLPSVDVLNAAISANEHAKQNDILRSRIHR